MAGGEWSATQMPVLPGLYMNFKAAALAAIQPGARGVVAIPVKAHWGPVKQFTDITSEAQIIETFTADISNDATAYNSLYFAILGGASKVLAYRLADGDAAKATTILVDTGVAPGVNVIKLDAKYEGARGNNFKATVQVNPIDALKKDIKLYEGTTLLRTFTFISGTIDAVVNAINEDSANIWITATKMAEGAGALKNVASQAFANGDSGIDGVVAQDYTNWLAALETQLFNLLALDGISDGAIHTSVSAWIKRVREEGKGIIGVFGGSAADDIAADAVAKATARAAGFNHEGIVCVGVGANLDGTDYSSAQVACYVAGLIGGQKLSESITYAATPFDDVTRRWTKAEMEQAVTGGVYLLFHDGRIVKGLRGVNSLVTLRQGQNNSWKKVRAIRVMDAINVDLQTTAEANYIGKVNNTAEGRASLLGAFKTYMQLLGMDGVIETTGFDVYLDPDYYGATAKVTPEADQVFTKWEARLTDVMEQIFGNFIVH
ncbi:MAG: phage tail sheath subtilisin-like domain-containing protein [Syntrophomonas sp.]